MHAATTYLSVALKTLETNEPINRREGNLDQANLEKASIVEIREGLAILSDSLLSHQKAPVIIFMFAP